MSTMLNNNRERSLPLSYRVYLLVAVFLISLMVAGTFFALANTSKKVKADSSSFTFTTTGDYGEGTGTPAVLKAIGSSGVNFNMATGDLNYDYPTVTAQQWVTYAQQNLGSNSPPFEFIAGDHDYGKAPSYGKGDLSALETLLPWQTSLGTISGPAYGEEYSFDFPASKPLARFIMVSPGIFPTSKYNYSANQTDYNWVKNQIIAAKKNGEWVIVGMAEGCLFIGSPSDQGVCQDSDLTNLLLNQNVDLVLQAHLHYYARSNPIALNSNCSSIPSDGHYVAACVGNPTDNYTQGKGTVFVNDGTGGKSLITINDGTAGTTKDPRTGYFRTWMGTNTPNKAYGYSKYTISASQISMQFVPATGGSGAYTDSFTISNGNATPTPTPTSTNTPTPTPTSTSTSTPTPTSTPGTTIAQDTFQRTQDQSEWGQASDGINTWGADANNLPNFSIASDTGQVTGSGSSATTYTGVLGESATDAEVVTSGSLSSFGTNTLGAVLRWTNNNNFYKAYITGTNLVISKKFGGVITKMKSVSFTATAGTSYTIDFSVVGTTLTATAWPSSDNSKSVTVTTTDSSLTSGQCGVLVYLTNGTIADFSSFLATSH